MWRQKYTKQCKTRKITRVEDKAHLRLVLLLEHRQQLGDDLVGDVLDVSPSLDGADGVHVRHLLEHVICAKRHADLHRNTRITTRRSND